MTNGYDLGLILKNLRIKSGLSQQQLGAKINRDKGIISRYENNYQTPSFETMRDFAAIFNVSMDYLAGTEKKDLISVRGLSEEQVDIISRLVDIFRASNSDALQKLSPEQYKILGRIVANFSSNSYNKNA
jgi:transcriptional regulator with XRE-family HTH domain